MKQTTNSIVMIRPVAFRMNRTNFKNNYYQKVLDGLFARDCECQRRKEFDTFVVKLP
jgi:hypothetical protein